MDLLLDVIGWLGAGLLVLGYGLISTSRLSGDSMTYQVINLVGSVTLMVNSAYNDAWPSAGLNLVWAAIGVVALVKLVRIGAAR
ncbi:CBU_0592 family membrane protein [Nonomuraea cavernae]|uniref:CBU_0592 family membrane protein n=1 Tax=Nonomuraea cavernae TaxID=2045107 RepID=UPI0033EAB880